MLMSQKIFS